MLLAWLKRRVFESRDVSSAAFHSRDLFLAIIKRERLRCDRHGRGFALLSLELKDQRERRRSLGSLAEILRQRLRATDEVGLLEHDRLGALLPDTLSAGAHTAARDLAMKFSQQSINVDLHVWSYPAEEDLDEPTGDAGEERRRAAPLVTLFEQRMPAWKRLVDVAGAFSGILVLSPLLMLVAAAIKLTSPGKVIFRQRRAGLGGRPFTMFKFRTMVANADQLKAGLLHANEQEGPAFKIERDPRVTRIGNLLRKTSIDELPQLWNVLRGDMSLVGPRPLPVEESRGCIHWQQRRHDVTPGLTCIWQVKDRRNKLSFADWVRMDLQYIHTRSLWRDLVLIVQTFATVVFRYRFHHQPQVSRDADVAAAPAVGDGALS